MGDARVPMSAVLSAFGVGGTVTRPAPDNAPIATTVVWIPPTPDAFPEDSPFQRREGLAILAISFADVPTVPEGTRIDAPPDGGGASRAWRVEGVLAVDADVVRVVVIEDPA